MKQYPDDDFIGGTDDQPVAPERQIVVTPQAGEVGGVPIWVILAVGAVILFNKEIKKLLQKI
jgi:hypothetical protein